MKKLFALVICLVMALSCTAFAVEPEATPEVTPVPEGMVVPTRTPVGWIQIGDFGTNADTLTQEERNDLISTLQASNVRNAVAEVPVVRGLATTRENPCYIGQQAQFNQQVPLNLNSSAQACRVYMQMTDIKRGDEAFAALTEVNPLNPAPNNGKAYVVATLSVGMTCEDPSLSIPFSAYFFSGVTAEGETLAYPTGITDNASSVDLYSGAIAQVRLVVEVDDPNADLYFVYRDSVWFSTMEYVPSNEPTEEGELVDLGLTE